MGVLEPTWINVNGIAVARWGTGERIVLCSHGITANAIEFTALAEEIAGDEITVLAPDHRGRGRFAIGAPR